MTLAEANAFVVQHHRHHKPVPGTKFAIGCSQADKVVGVVLVGRPGNRVLGRHVPVINDTRVKQEVAELMRQREPVPWLTDAAKLIHCTLRGWQEWEAGNRKMHPAFWELFRIKLNRTGG